jgi:hypothetical protein
MANVVAPGTEAEWEAHVTPAVGAALPMPPRRIERALRRPNQIFARIYSFSFEGHYYDLPRPLLFLVTGNGIAPQAIAGGVLGFNTKRAGLAAKDWSFSNDILVWAVDKKDLAVCLDVEVGNYQEVLLDSMVAFEEMSARGAAASRGARLGGRSFARRCSFTGRRLVPRRHDRPAPGLVARAVSREAQCGL